MKPDLRKNVKILIYCLLFSFLLLPSIVILLINISDYDLKLSNFYEILSYYKEFLDFNLSLILSLLISSILFFIIVKALKLFHVILSKRIGTKKAHVIYFSILFIFVIEFVLEYPLLFNKELIFSKSVETKYCFSSMEYQVTLSQNDIIEIYSTILNKDSCFVLNRLSNNAGLFGCNNEFQYTINLEIQEKLLSYWSQQGFKNTFVSDIDEVYADGSIIYNFTLVTMGPIKKIDDIILIGYSEYRGFLNAVGYLIKIEKINGKWEKQQFTIGWIS